MNENQQNATEFPVQVSDEKRRGYFAAGMIRWILNESNSSCWGKDFAQKCQALALEAKNLGNLPSESTKKSQATLKAVPAAVLYWLGIYTGFFWIIPGAAIGLAGSYLISNSIYEVFKAGKDARFYRTFLHYLLRMENADGVISREEIASLRTIIEFIPAPPDEKKQWLAAIESPDGYQKLKPSLRLSDDERDQILSGCWGLALCDGSDDAEREIFTLFGAELDVPDERLVKIQQKMEAQIAQHTYLVEETMRTTAILHPAPARQREKAAEILSLLSLKPVSQKEWLARIDQILSPESQNPDYKNNSDEFTPRILLAGLLLSRFLSESEPACNAKVTENFLNCCHSSGLETQLQPLAAEIDRAIALIN